MAKEKSQPIFPAWRAAAGKYNNGARENRAVLAGRIHKAMVEASESTKKFPLTNLMFRTVPVSFEPRSDAGFTPEDLEKKLAPSMPPFQQCLAAMGLSWRNRLQATHPIHIDRKSTR